MLVEVNGAKLYFDVEGAGLLPDGDSMREQPTLLLLHGGPGVDHSIYKPAFSALADCAQIVYLDHRGNGRSDECDSTAWTLAQWGDDVRGFCDVLGIKKPIVLGTSFGGFVAQSYATRYPEHLSKLILVSTAAKMNFDTVFAAFERIGGPQSRQVAERYWSKPTSETRAEYLEICVPFYRARGEGSKAWLSRAIIKDEVALWFNGPDNEHGRMDFRSDLARIQCPVLVLAGEQDPITPVEFSREIAASIADTLVRFEQFAGCGHGVVGDCPERALKMIREFISEH